MYNTDKELQAALVELKDGLYEVTTAEARTEIQKQIAQIETRFAAIELNQDALLKGPARTNHGINNRGIEGLISNTLKSNEGRIREFMQRKTAGDLQLEIKVAGDMGLGNITGGTTSISTVLPGITSEPRRKNHIGPLLQRVPITGDMVALRQNGPGEGSISAVGENAQKPQVDYDLQETTFASAYIAGFARVSRRFMISVPGATEFLTQRLLEDWYVVEDNLLLNGTGIPPEMKGINTAGNYTDATSLPADNNFVQLIKGVGQLAALGRNPDMIILHPDDAYNLMVNTAQGSGEFDSPAVVQINADGSMRIAGTPVVMTTAQTVNTYNVVDRSGLIVGVLDALNVRFFESDQDNVIKNLVTIRVEANEAFAVLGSNYVIKGTFETIPLRQAEKVTRSKAA